jgi:hypothetical protein
MPQHACLQLVALGATCCQHQKYTLLALFDQNVAKGEAACVVCVMCGGAELAWQLHASRPASAAVGRLLRQLVGRLGAEIAVMMQRLCVLVPLVS